MSVSDGIYCIRHQNHSVCGRYIGDMCVCINLTDTYMQLYFCVLLSGCPQAESRAVVPGLVLSGWICGRRLRSSAHLRVLKQNLHGAK